MTSPAVSGQIDGASRVCRSTNHFKVDHEGSTVIMSVEAGKFFTFDAIGFEIWEAFDEPRAVSEVVDELTARHHAPRDRVETDVIAFLDRLADENLLDLD